MGVGRVSITLDLPVDGNGRDYVGAISRAIDQAASRGDRTGTDALAGLLAVLRLSFEGIEGAGFVAAQSPRVTTSEPSVRY
jgi:hypothetical protein